MLRPRIIPCLLVHQGGLVKTVGFKDPKYVGDPINAVKIFNEKESDELIVLDIDATVNGADPDYGMIRHLAAECRMPLCYGGGIRDAEQAKKIIGLGVEKVSLSAAAAAKPELIAEISEAVGRQSVVVVIATARWAGTISTSRSSCASGCAFRSRCSAVPARSTTCASCSTPAARSAPRPAACSCSRASTARC